ncbi:transcriptional regulation of mitochondrial recombination-domain-containing protein [Microdochium trichocladiopsis]|uniref:Large ribosomal subunit protein mL67 n=1 Tax=Microdochium trichocladiopsis TaxID=1682393 RepID=A0A9P9C0H2_9PEZI|nr:transcriptional regulation of mitochondrial recombination-domain-containing protein [Microdochium trichocladiopsis]KAH7041099.1 transcriptional regulation of mitochondrial recombination-domain-containing protein [Microdochium trichocladiopsis]
MALRLKPVTAQLAKLSASSLRPSARAACAIASRRPAIRSLTTESSHTTISSSSPTSELPASMVPRDELESIEESLPDDTPRPASWPHGHGDRIWFFRHFLDGLTIFSLQRNFKANKQMRTIPYNGKKLKPSKIRKDYWEPFAMVEFPEGHRLVGLSVYHMLREAHFLHSYTWDGKKQPSLVRDPETGATLDKHGRGVQLNRHMLPNSIADMAAVLGGLGKGNKIWVTRPGEVAAEDGSESGGVRVPATIYWADPNHKDYAAAWPDNVTHVDAAEAAERLAPQPLPQGNTL